MYLQLPNSWLQTVVLVLLFFIPFNSTHSQSSDTVLNMVLSKPYFYNIIVNSQETIYAGTSEGMLEINGTNLRSYNHAPGYITFGKNGLPEIDSNGIQFYKERSFLHLLPYPEIQRDEYHAGKGNVFYVCSGGRLYIFDILPYEYSYSNHSIRTISKDFVGTYSGIYLKGQLLDKSIFKFTDGYIRQFGNRAFLCNYGLYVFEKEALDSGNFQVGKNAFIYAEPSGQFTNDIFPAPDNEHYYVASQYKLSYLNYDFTYDSLLFKHTIPNSPVGLITDFQYSLLYFAGNELYSLKSGFLTKLPEPIQSGLSIGNQIYLVSNKGLYRYNSNKELEKLVDLTKAHSIVAISGSELVIASDLGLYLFNLVSRELFILIKGVEFNRKALYKNQQEIKAGSINGLYTIKIADIPKLVKENQSQVKLAEGSKKELAILSIVAALVLGLLVLLFRYRKKLEIAQKTIEEIQTPELQETISRDKIETFIVTHLPNASIKTIGIEFGLSAQQLYDVLKPDKPGSIIQKFRLDLVRKMRAEQKTAEEISAATGFSITYLKKIKNEA